MTTPADHSEFSAASAGRLLGTNDLQPSIDQNTQAIKQLTSAVQQMQKSSAVSSSASPAMAGGKSGSTWGAGTPTAFPKASSNGGSGSSGPPTVATAAPMGGGNANGGGSGTAGQSLMGGGAMGVLSSFKNYGQNQLPAQVSMNAYAQQAMLGVAPGAPNATSRLYNQAFGTYNKNLNTNALSPQDAAQGQLTLNQIASSPFPSSTSLGRAGQGATAAFGYMNPSLGYAGSAQMASQMYSGQTSFAMRQMGYGATPRAGMGQSGNMSSAQTVQTMLQRWYGKGSVSSNTLNAGLGQNGKANLNLQALGLNPAQFGPMIQGYNKLFQQGVSPQKAQQLFSQAQTNTGGAQNQLNKYGISNSDLQKMKNVNAVQTGRDSGVSGGFNDGLSAATTGLQHFNAALNSVLSGPLGTATGYAGGMSGVLGSTAGGTMTSGLGSFMGMLGAGKLLGAGGAGGAASALGGSAGRQALTKFISGAGGASSIASELAPILIATVAIPAVSDAIGKHVPGYQSTLNTIQSAGANAKKKAPPGTGWAVGLSNAVLDKPEALAGSAFKDLFNALSSVIPHVNRKKTLNQGGGAGVSVGGGGSVSIAGSAQSKGSAGSTISSGVGGNVQTAVKDAVAQVGKPYVWGGDSPATSFDCSGLVEWAYKQAGISLPRTSQQQWAALTSKSVPMNKVQEGDIVFAAGSDGTATAPGHEALMISGNQIVEAATTGTNIRIRSYNPAEWQHAGRPTGSMTNASGSTAASVSNSGSTGGSLHSGNGGLGLSAGAYGSSEEQANVQAALLGGIAGGSHVSFGSKGTGNGSGATGSASGSGKGVSTAGGGSISANKALAQKMAAQMYNWTGSQWSNGLEPLWMGESGFDNNIKNPTSTAYGIAQFLDSTWGPYGTKTSNPGLQIKYGLEYVHDRYGNPLSAESFKRAHNWYGEGTKNAMAGLALVGDRGPELVNLSGGEGITPNSKTAQMLKGTAALPTQSPWMAGTVEKLLLANTPQNAMSSPSKCEVNLHFPQGAIVIHTTGAASDVSSQTRQVIQGVANALADNETLKQIAAGNKG